MIAACIIFWICVLAILHSYVFYPLILRLLAAGKKLYVPPAFADGNRPMVHILMAAYNEEAVIRAKMENLLNADYPKDKLQIWVGSDNSTDGTNEILEEFAAKYPQVRVHIFKQRTGKIGIINQLFMAANTGTNDVLVMTDADVQFEKDTIEKLVEHFQDEQIGLVAANPRNMAEKGSGVSHLERKYIDGENRTKYLEGLLWGSMMGAFGAGYAVRANLFKAVPEHFKVDDFYISMQVLKQGYKAIKVPESICYEESPEEISEEFRRKVRIGTGNYQNLRAFASLLWPPFNTIAFAFLSHKVLRWLGPFLLIAMYLSNLALVEVNVFYRVAFLLQNFLLFLPLLETGLRKLGIHSIPLRFVTYFYYMNLALLVGFYKYLKGEQTNVWEPTKRKQ